MSFKIKACFPRLVLTHYRGEIILFLSYSMNTILQPVERMEEKESKERQRNWWEMRRVRDKERWRKRTRERCGLESNPHASLSALITLGGGEKHGTMAWPSLTRFHSPGSVQMIWSGRGGKNPSGSHRSDPNRRHAWQGNVHAGDAAGADAY